MTSHLRAMTWDHPRGTGPVRAATARWTEDHPDVEVNWDVRPLSAFEDQPIDELAATYDILMIDHPHIGAAADHRALLPLDEWMDADFMRDQRENSLGRSFDSYTYAGHQWALAVDAASQVGAYRTDLLEQVDATIPTSWEDVVDLATRTGGAQLLLPLNPTHAWCTLLALTQSMSPNLEPERREDTSWTELFADALRILSALIPHLDPRSEQADPITAGRLATTTDEILGIPLAFGYITFAHATSSPDRSLTHVDAPRGPAGLGSVLGGVGLALSARSTQPELAADLGRLVASPQFQREHVVDAGGQPGHRSAWTDAPLDAAVGRFFSSTLDSLDAACVRPRDQQAAHTQSRCAAVLHDHLWGDRGSIRACATELGRLMTGNDTTKEIR